MANKVITRLPFSIEEYLKTVYPDGEVLGEVQVTLKMSHYFSVPIVDNGKVKDSVLKFEADDTLYSVYRYTDRGVILNATYPTVDNLHLTIPFWKLSKAKVSKGLSV